MRVPEDYCAICAMNMLIPLAFCRKHLVIIKYSALTLIYSAY